MKGYLDAKELESYKKEDLQELAKQLGVDAEGTKKEIAARCAAVEVDIPDNSELTEEDKKVAAEAAAEAAAKAEEENKKKAEAMANVYVDRRKQFFDIDIKDGAIDIQVLKSVQEFFEEGKEMGHCVFRNGYYDVNRKPNCLILSAKVNGQRMETIEVNLADVTVVQCQGHGNINSAFHDTILKLIKDNLWQIESRLPNRASRTA